MVHWTDIIFVVVVLFLLYKTYNRNEEDYFSEVVQGFFGLMLILFIAIWGGIFWW